MFLYCIHASKMLYSYEGSRIRLVFLYHGRLMHPSDDMVQCHLWFLVGCSNYLGLMLCGYKSQRFFFFFSFAWYAFEFVWINLSDLRKAWKKYTLNINSAEGHNTMAQGHNPSTGEASL